MNRYLCHKEVLATPMTLQEYNDYHNWTLPKDVNGTDKGYLVEYIDGGEANHPNHQGYIAWSPKEVFERGYTEITSVSDAVSGVAPHQQRVIDEANEVSEKMGKLTEFRTTTTFANLSCNERADLQEQLWAMRQYHDVLTRRIVRFYNPSVA